MILVGEMRDVETISIALEASETGHLVLSTLHTIDATKTIDRIVGVFPKNEERQVRTRFSQSFKWIVSQRLVPKIGGGRMAVCEILRSQLAHPRVHPGGRARGQEPAATPWRTARSRGCRPSTSELERLIQAGVVDREVALSYATNRTNLQLRLETQSGARRRSTAPQVDPRRSSPRAPRPARRAGRPRARGPTASTT